jgi:flagellar basal-body rod protein FlgC
MYGALDISVSGMVAQRVRMDTIAANLANLNTILDENGEANPYQRRFAEFMPGDPAASTRDARALGVHVREIGIDDRTEPRKVWDPTNTHAKPQGHPDAGYVYFPSIDPVTEEINGLEAQRAYEANVTAAEATKSILAQALRMIA